MTDANASTINNVKVRVNGEVVVAADAAFMFEAPLRTLDAEVPIIYPSWPDKIPTTYDGSWTFVLTVAEGSDEIVVWDADFDYGSHDGATADGDDPDTVGGVDLPSIASSLVANEGSQGMGQPADDARAPAYRRSPSVIYDIQAPDGTVWTNSNPSGANEWERFTVRTAGHPDGCVAQVNADVCVGSLPAGQYILTIQGLDLFNPAVIAVNHPLTADRGESGGAVASAASYPTDSAVSNTITNSPVEESEIVFLTLVIAQ